MTLILEQAVTITLLQAIEGHAKLDSPIIRVRAGVVESGKLNQIPDRHVLGYCIVATATILGNRGFNSEDNNSINQTGTVIVRNTNL